MRIRLDMNAKSEAILCVLRCRQDFVQDHPIYSYDSYDSNALMNAALNSGCSHASQDQSQPSCNQLRSI